MSTPPIGPERDHHHPPMPPEEPEEHPSWSSAIGEVFKSLFAESGEQGIRREDLARTEAAAAPAAAAAAPAEVRESYNENIERAIENEIQRAEEMDSLHAKEYKKTMAPVTVINEEIKKITDRQDFSKFSVLVKILCRRFGVVEDTNRLKGNFAREITNFIKIINDKLENALRGSSIEDVCNIAFNGCRFLKALERKGMPTRNLTILDAVKNRLEEIIDESSVNDASRVVETAKKLGYDLLPVIVSIDTVTKFNLNDKFLEKMLREFDITDNINYFVQDLPALDPFHKELLSVLVILKNINEADRIPKDIVTGGLIEVNEHLRNIIPLESLTALDALVFLRKMNLGDVVSKDDLCLAKDNLRIYFGDRLSEEQTAILDVLTFLEGDRINVEKGTLDELVDVLQEAFSMNINFDSVAPIRDRLRGEAVKLTDIRDKVEGTINVIEEEPIIQDVFNSLIIVLSLERELEYARPEMVVNSDDEDHILAQLDILAEALPAGSSLAGKFGQFREAINTGRVDRDIAAAVITQIQQGIDVGNFLSDPIVEIDVGIQLDTLLG